MHRLACRAACLPVFAASLFLAPTVPVVLLFCVACVTPMRFLVYASGDRKFGFTGQTTAAAPARSPLTASARTALLGALALPVKALDACAAPFLVATAGQAAVAVAPCGGEHGRCSSDASSERGLCALGNSGDTSRHPVLLRRAHASA
eukprot:4055617-Pleurochrysis_carterae.AAC.1